MKIKTILLFLALCVTMGVSAQSKKSEKAYYKAYEAMRKSQQKFLDEAEKYINTDNGKTPNVAAARLALNSAGGEGTAEYEIVAGDVEKIAYKDAQIKNDEAALGPAGLAAFDHYKKAYALALNKKPDIVKRAQEGALFVLEMTSGMVTVGMTYAAKQEFRKALEAWHTALTAVKEPVLTSNPQAQNAIKRYSEDSFVDMLIRNCIGIAYHSLEDKEAVKELEFLKPRARGMEMKNTVCQALALRYYVVDNQSAYEAVLKEGFDKFPDEPWFMIQLVSLYMSKKDYAAANQYLDKAIARDPNNDDRYRTKGVFLQEQGKKAEALTYYQKALKMNPNSVNNNYTMGWYYFSEDDVDKALLYYEKAYSLDTKHESTLVCDGLKGVYWIKSVNAGETTPEGKRWAEKRQKVMAEYGTKAQMRYHDVELYDAKGNVKSITTYLGELKPSTTEFTIDGKEKDLTGAEYDSNGYRVSWKSRKYFWVNGRTVKAITSDRNPPFIVNGKYNAKGELIEMSMGSVKPNAIQIQYSDYKYDARGNWISRKRSSLGVQSTETRTIEYY